MKLLNDIIIKKIEIQQELEIKHEYLLSVWNFYSLYGLCLALLDEEDKMFTKKNFLVKKLIESDSEEIDMRVYNLIQKFIKKDSYIIEKAIKYMQEQQFEGGYMGDYDQPSAIMISTDE